MDDECERSCLTFETIDVGMKIIDEDDRIGIIKDCTDIYNILVEYENGSSGLYCLDKESNLYTKIYEYDIDII